MSPICKPVRPILVVDDEKGVLMGITGVLRQSGLSNVLTSQDSRKVMKIISENKIGVLLLDLFMPHVSGEEILRQVIGAHPEIPVIVITGVTDVHTAVRCMKAGAYDYLTKPVEHEALVATVGRAIEFGELKEENKALKQRLLSNSLKRPEAFARIITKNRAILSIFQYIESIAPSSQPVLVTGETGVGKELIIQAIHNLSDREGELVLVNVAGLDDHIFSDTLFGHVRGAYTGADQVRPGMIEKAAGGTLVLDEIGDLSAASQVKLLRLVQSGDYMALGQDETKYSDARIVASTNQDLWALQQRGDFRQDLNYRLLTHHIHLPPLRDRLDDLPLLVEFFLEEASSYLEKKKPAYPKELYNLLGAYSFPGNIRELRAMIYEAVSRHKSRVLSLEAFHNHINQVQAQQRPHDRSLESDDIKFPAILPSIKQTIDRLVGEAMKRAGGNQSVAAKMIGITPQALGKRLKKKNNAPETT